MGVQTAVANDTQQQHLSINEAAAELGVKPWEVVRLIEKGQLRTVVLVDAASLTEYREEQR